MASSRFNPKYDPQTGDIDVEFDYVKPTDVGTYKCKAENIYGFDNTKSNILIINLPNIDERPQTVNPDMFKKLGKRPDDSKAGTPAEENGKPPKFIVHLPAEVKLHDGVKFSTRCKIEGFPLPKVFLNCFCKDHS